MLLTEKIWFSCAHPWETIKFSSHRIWNEFTIRRGRAGTSTSGWPRFAHVDLLFFCFFCNQFYLLSYVNMASFLFLLNALKTCKAGPVTHPLNECSPLCESGCLHCRFHCVLLSQGALQTFLSSSNTSIFHCAIWAVHFELAFLK